MLKKPRKSARRRLATCPPVFETRVGKQRTVQSVLLCTQVGSFSERGVEFRGASIRGETLHRQRESASPQFLREREKAMLWFRKKSFVTERGGVRFQCRLGKCTLHTLSHGGGLHTSRRYCPTPDAWTRLSLCA